MREVIKVCEPGEGAPKLVKVLDYPRGDEGRALRIAEELCRAGVTEVVLEGEATLPGGVKVLGRGHAAVVLLANLGGVGEVAIKVRRAGSKRESLALECGALGAAWPVAPRVYRCTDEFIIMDLVKGYPVAEVARYVKGCGGAVALAAKVAEAARWLDRVGVCHEELSDLRGHAFIEGGAIKFIDFESASMRYCCVVCKVMSWVLHRSPLPRACPRLTEVEGCVREALRAYKRGPGKEGFLAVIRALARALE